jgi:hypothetical protein
VPKLCVHTPEVPIKPEVFTAREPELAVCVPVNPEIVTVEPVGKSTLAVRITEIVTVAPPGVCCGVGRGQVAMCLAMCPTWPNPYASRRKKRVV